MIAQEVLGLINKIRETRKTMKVNHGQKATLAERVLVLEPDVKRILEGRLLLSTAGQMSALNMLKIHITKADEIVGRFGEKTAWRKMDRFFKHNSWAQEFASINAALTQACSDLQFTMVINAEERRAQDLYDQTLAFEELILQATKEMHEDNEATEENLRLLQLQVAEQHKAVVNAIISINNYSPLAPADLRSLEQQNQALNDLSRQQFASLGFKIDAVVKLLQDGYGSEEQQRLRKQRLAELTLRESDIELLHAIGEGGFGNVWMGLLARNIVAVKVIKLPGGRPLNSSDKEVIENELIITRYLAHPNIMTVYGFCHKPDQTLAVAELAPYGDLFDLLHDEVAFPVIPFALSLGWLCDLACAAKHVSFEAVCVHVLFTADFAPSFPFNLSVVRQGRQAQGH